MSTDPCPTHMGTKGLARCGPQAAPCVFSLFWLQAEEGWEFSWKMISKFLNLRIHTIYSRTGPRWLGWDQPKEKQAGRLEVET